MRRTYWWAIYLTLFSKWPFSFSILWFISPARQNACGDGLSFLPSNWKGRRRNHFVEQVEAPLEHSTTSIIHQNSEASLPLHICIAPFLQKAILVVSCGTFFLDIWIHTSIPRNVQQLHLQIYLNGDHEDFLCWITFRVIDWCLFFFFLLANWNVKLSLTGWP